MKNKTLRIIIGMGIAASILAGCDSRSNVINTKPQASFSTDFIAVKDLSRGIDIAQAQFRRNDLPYVNGRILIGIDTLRSNSSGVYSAQTPLLSLFIGSNAAIFASPTDGYTRSIAFEMPDSFRITSVSPFDNQGGADVTVQWSHPNRTTGFILSVYSQNYLVDGTSPLKLQLSSDVTTFVVPDTTFEDAAAILKPGLYYVYVTAFNGGFGVYPGIPFPLPTGLPARPITEPSGSMRVGIVAPVDSIRVR